MPKSKHKYSKPGHRYRVNFEQYPLRVACKLYPQLFSLLPWGSPFFDFHDPNYFVRITHSGIVEIGYLDDPWVTDQQVNLEV